MKEQFSRTAILYGEASIERLQASRVAVFGIGGVGGYVVEALARSGIGALDLIDNDVVCESNLNRQIIATTKTLGEDKVDVAARRVHEIAPDCKVRTYKTFFLPQTQELFDFGEYDYVVDAIDTISGKLAIIECAKKAGVPVISSMGAGNKIHPALFEVADIYETSVCPLAKVMRRECKKRGITSLKVVYSKEEPRKAADAGTQPCGTAGNLAGVLDRSADAGTQPCGTAGSLAEQSRNAAGNIMDFGEKTVSDGVEAVGSTAMQCTCKDAPGIAGPRPKPVPGSVAFVPSVVGLIIAGEVVNDLTGMQ